MSPADDAPPFTTAIGVSDEALMLAYAQGDAAAFEPLYQRHADALYRYFLRCTGREEVAADLSQDLWLALTRTRRSYVASAAFRHYLFRMAHNHVVSHWRRQSPQIDLECVAAELIADGTPEEQVLMADSQGRLAAAIQRLNPVQREVVMLRLEGELSFEQIASLQNAGYEAVKTRYRLAVAKLREWIGHE